MTEALRNLYILAKKLTDCSFHPSTWNMFQHDGVTTNNSSEGYNFRLGNKEKICPHPNFFQFVENVIAELKNSYNEAAKVDGGKSNFRRRGKVL